MPDDHTPFSPNQLKALKALQSQIQLIQQPLPVLVNPKIELERKKQEVLNAMYQLQLKQEVERNLQIKAQQRMIETHKQIIQALINDFDAGETGVDAEVLSNKLGLDLHTVKYCLKLLSESGCIKLVESRYLSGNEHILVTRIESKSYMFLRGEVPLDNSGAKPSIHMENSNYIEHSNNINGNHNFISVSTQLEEVDKKQAKELLAEIEKVISQINLGDEIRTELESDIATTQIQLNKQKPKKELLKALFEEIQKTFKGAAEKAVAAEIGAHLLQPIIEKIGYFISHLR